MCLNERLFGMNSKTIHLAFSHRKAASHMSKSIFAIGQVVLWCNPINSRSNFLLLERSLKLIVYSHAVTTSERPATMTPYDHLSIVLLLFQYKFN